MPKLTKNFIGGRMNKVVDERLLPEGEYIDAMNIRMGSTEKSEIGVIENTKGNLPLTKLAYFNAQLSTDAVCIGSATDPARETIYWFVHDSNFSLGPTGKIDLIVSYNVLTDILTYHVVSINDGGNTNTTLNFNPQYLITGVNIIEDLLFFTDDINPPRCINVKRNYPDPIGVSFVDSVTSESLMVIKKPPIKAPVITLLTTAGQENFLETRFISFAYRYRYEDGEYSATSQWSDIAFESNPFEFSINSVLNEGMTNNANTAVVEYNSGGPLVKGIDLLFKEANNSVIKVIERIDKADSGLADNNFYQYTFSNSKIFSILPTSEILRLYDNVPLTAKAQTIMGNRLMYGNYIEGYDLLDRNANPVKFEYQAQLVTEDIGLRSLPYRLDGIPYNLDPVSPPVAVNDSVIYFDLANVPLVAGSAIQLELRIDHSQFSGDTPFPTATTNQFSLDFTFYLSNNYGSVYQLATSTEFQSAIGTLANIKPVYSSIPGVETSCDGITLTDQLNCTIPQTLGGLQKFASGISSVTPTGQPIEIISTLGGTEIGLRLIAMMFVDNPNGTITQTVYEYYEIVVADVTYLEIANPRSLHSNRGYEIGIVYMDEFLRSTTALVSPNNTVYVPCGNSPKKNSIRVTIPKEQIAPAWAKRYKFVIKPDAENYEVIYSNLFVTDPSTNESWFLLEGENEQKVETGDRYIVKTDTNGPLTNCAYATVLDKRVVAADSLVPNQLNPAGVYMKILPNDFTAIAPDEAVVKFPYEEQCAPKGGNYTIFRRAINIEDPGWNPLQPSWNYRDYDIPAGSRIFIKLNWLRQGVGNACERRGYTFERTFIASNDYNNFEDWWDGDNVISVIQTEGTSIDGSTSIEFNPVNAFAFQTDFNINYIQFWREPTNNALLLQVSSGESCTGVGAGDKRKYCVGIEVIVYRAATTLIFETLPQDATPNIYYENNLSFEIDSNGNHFGNVQNQNISTNTPAIINTEFFNCISFGNGAESYKIRDSITGKSFNLGERVTSVSSQEYKKSDRFADITYSGVYNAENNINRLNEFNLGLFNYKNLELSFGAIYILDGRQTDVLTLQEERISYVLAGKNLLSDSIGGGAIASVPEVLGTQIARTEKYGISFNPESYVQWGFNRFFTDVKRGAVLQLIGNSSQNDDLKVISDDNMRTWFRDEFNSSFDTQKLGGFDPYMNEYVLSSNTRRLPINEECIDCGITQTFNFSKLGTGSASYNFCVELGSIVGNTTLTWNPSLNLGGNFQVIINYNGSIYVSPFTTTSGSLSFNKNDILVTTAEVTIIYTSTVLNIDFNFECPVPERLRIIQVVVNSSADANKTIHIEYRYQNGAYISPLQSNFVKLAGTAAPTVSAYISNIGDVGTGGFPPESSTLTIRTNKLSTDTYDFQLANDKLRYLRTNVLYPNTQIGIETLLALANDSTPITQTGSVFSSNFIVPLNTEGNILYLVWDLRDVLQIPLCAVGEQVGKTEAQIKKEACCDCDKCPPSNCVRVRVYNASNTRAASIFFPIGQDNACTGNPTGPFTLNLNPAETWEECLIYSATEGVPYTVIAGTAYVVVLQCNC